MINILGEGEIVLAKNFYVEAIAVKKFSFCIFLYIPSLVVV
jgi:hypothetical protein